MKKSISAARKPTHEEIAQVAYCFYEERGRQPGHEVEDWLRAEAHVSTDEKHVGEPSENVTDEFARNQSEQARKALWKN